MKHNRELTAKIAAAFFLCATTATGQRIHQGDVQVVNNTDHSIEVIWHNKKGTSNFFGQDKVTWKLSPYETQRLSFDKSPLKVSEFRYQIRTSDANKVFFNEDDELVEKTIGIKPDSKSTWMKKHPGTGVLRVIVDDDDIVKLPVANKPSAPLFIKNSTDTKVRVECWYYKDRYGQDHGIDERHWVIPANKEIPITRDGHQVIASYAKFLAMTPNGTSDGTSASSFSISDGRLVLRIDNNDLPSKLNVPPRVKSRHPELVDLIEGCFWVQNSFRQDELDAIERVMNSPIAEIRNSTRVCLKTWTFFVSELRERGIEQTRFTHRSNPYGLDKDVAAELLGRVFVINASSEPVRVKVLGWMDHLGKVHTDENVMAGHSFPTNGRDYMVKRDGKLVVGISAHYVVETKRGEFIKEGIVETSDDEEPNRMISPRVAWEPGYGRRFEIVINESDVEFAKRRKRAFRSFLIALGLEAAAQIADKNEGVGRKVFASVSRTVRDRAIEDLFKNIVPTDTPDNTVDALTAVTALFIDGELSLSNLKRETAEAAIVRKLREENIEWDEAIKLADLVYDVCTRHMSAK